MRREISTEFVPLPSADTARAASIIEGRWKGLLIVKTIFGTLAILVALTTNAAAQTDRSANHYLAACRDYATPKVPEGADDYKEWFTMGECLGIIEVLAATARLMPVPSKSCTPSSVTKNQLVSVIVRWLDQPSQPSAPTASDCQTEQKPAP